MFLESTFIIKRRPVGAGFACYAYTPARADTPAPASRAITPTHRLMKRPTAQHGGTCMEHQWRMRDNQSD